MPTANPANPGAARNLVKTTSGAQLDLSQVEPADIVLTAGPSAASRGIRGATCASFSHAILVAKDGLCIESVTGPGVDTPKLVDALDQSTRASLFRHKLITPTLANSVIAYARQQKGKPYDYSGAARAGVASGCTPLLQYSGSGGLIILSDTLAKGGSHDDSFYCSELVAFAFQKAGIRLVDIPFFKASPRAIAKSSQLAYQQELIIT